MAEIDPEARASSIYNFLVLGLLDPQKFGEKALSKKRPTRILQETWDLARARIKWDLENPNGGGPQRERGYDNQRRSGNQKEH